MALGMEFDYGTASSFLHLPICRCTFSGKSKWYVASASPAALSIGSENQIPKIFMQFPSMETFFYQSCQSISLCSLYFLNLLHGLLRSCQSFFEILMRFIHCWVKNRYWVCTSVSKPLMSLYWHLIKGKDQIRLN